MVDFEKNIKGSSKIIIELDSFAYSTTHSLYLKTKYTVDHVCPVSSPSEYSNRKTVGRSVLSRYVVFIDVFILKVMITRYQKNIFIHMD